MPDQVQDPSIRILKVASCSSLSGRSTLTYHLGSSGPAGIYLRIYHNTGSGYFSQDWISFAEIEALMEGATSITSYTFRSIFQGKSVNTAGFLLAVLKDVGLIQTKVDNLRYFERTGSDAFIQEAKALQESAVDLKEADLTKVSGLVKKVSHKARSKSRNASQLE